MNNNKISFIDYPSVILLESLYQDSKVILVADIIYIEAYRNKCVVHMNDGKAHEFGNTMKSIEKDLDPAVFVKIHRSFIINIKHLDSCCYGYVTMKNHQELPIGDNCRLEKFSLPTVAVGKSDHGLQLCCMWQQDGSGICGGNVEERRKSA